MAYDIGAFGLSITLFASVTFPNGITITEFADDADPMDVPSIQIVDKAMTLNGRMVRWGKPVAVEMTINVIPGSDDDINLGILFDNNRTVAGSLPIADEITAVSALPDGSTRNYSGGTVTDYMAGPSVASSARRKTRSYKFAFESAQ